MSESIALVTARQRVLVRLTTVEVDRVVGVVASNSATQIADGYILDGTEQAYELCLPQCVLDRLLQFYDECMSREGRVPSYNCHGFVSFVLGRTVSYRPSDANLGSATIPARAHQLEPAGAYAIVSGSGNAAHSMMGVNDPELNLSVLGMFGPLALADTVQLRMAYGGSLRQYAAADTLDAQPA